MGEGRDVASGGREESRAVEGSGAVFDGRIGQVGASS